MNAPTPRRSRFDRLLRLAALAVLAPLLLFALFVAGRILLHRQSDDPVRLDHKRAYLESIRSAASADAPNIVLILFDDLGYGDIGAYGGSAIRTPALDRLAAASAMFTHAYSASPYCSASRAGLLTGRYAVRSGMDHVLQAPWSDKDLLLRLGWRNRRLPAEEITLTEVLRAAGYATAMVGKWHLGDASPSLPNDLGFDSFYGLLYSNDQGEPAVWQDREIVERHPIDQTTLTRRYTEHAVDFIERHHDERFFLYMPHTFPHIPLHAPADRRGTSEAGLYGDVVEELDESVARVLEALGRTGVERDTLVVVSSDNGPWFQGSPGGIRGRKMDIFEGGMRVPLLVAWPERIPSRVIGEPVIAVDLFPTVLELLGLQAPRDRVIDGESLAGLLLGEPARRHGPIYFHQIDVPRAVRHGRFKYHDRHGVVFGNPPDWSWGHFRDRGPWLFDLERDPDESYDVSDRHSREAERLRETLDAHRRELDENGAAGSERHGRREQDVAA